MNVLLKRLLIMHKDPGSGGLKRVIIATLGVVLLVVAFALLIPEQTNTSSQNVAANVVIKNNQVISGPSVITALKGDNVTIKITSDQPGELHLHGYDKTVQLEADRVAVLTFKANETGKFEYELEQSELTLGQLEVYPR